MNRDQFTTALREKGIKLTEYQLDQFDTYFHTLVEWNHKVNLTSLTSEVDVYLKHFFDSISAAFYYDFSKEIHICDVGAGAGFPSIPLKICFPHLKVKIVDSLQKRIGFLKHLQEQLKIDDVSFYHSRAEDFGRNIEFRENFDVVIARAVARLSVLSELCIPLVRNQGVFIAMKGAQAEEEIENGELAVKTLGGKISNFHTFTLPHENSERSIIIINKQRKSPKKYPRKAGTPNKDPIE